MSAIGDDAKVVKHGKFTSKRAAATAQFMNGAANNTITANDRKAVEQEMTRDASL